MTTTAHQADVIIVGAGLAGTVAAIELLDHSDQRILLIDRDEEAQLGGLAKWSFGGMFFANSPVQRKAGIQDSVDLALKDWYSFAEFGPDDQIPRQWAEQFVHLSTPQIHDWLRDRGIKFFPTLNWVERGLYRPGNSLPRFHMVWGTGYELTQVINRTLRNHPKKDRVSYLFQHRVKALMTENGAIKGVRGQDESTQTPFEARADVVIVASGGINGSIEKVKKNWFKGWGTPPETILTGAHPYAIGDMHEAVEHIDGHITHLDRQWNYAAGVHHPTPHWPNYGLSLVPSKSALWLNYQGKRFGPMPMVSPYDTRFLLEQICKEPVKYSWQLLNRKIMLKEFAISGSESNEAIREKNRIKFIKTILLGNKKLMNYMLNNCVDFVTGNSLGELAEKMNALTGENHVRVQNLRDAVGPYDAQIDRGPKYFNDEQLRRIAHVRNYVGDKLRTCKFQKILDEKAMPLVAIRVFVLSRKSLGGIQTDLRSRVLALPDAQGQQQAIPGLYAVGESAGFGGGNLHGWRALEGTFLSGCVLSARIAAQDILGKKLR